ncbi:MAG: ATP-binding cassette domain-containing protein [Gammaproteobacteria bacterium]|nr:ATP-binding cassette domain-containing protein [Pseudomonadales bacterium]MCP5346904.1 ATP-binding cassette domain-containing protein [Pseudomonadales bacterium]
MSATVTENPPLISVSEARVRINRRRILGVDGFSLSPGQHWCILGGNGAGKSQFARLLRGELVSGRQHVSYADGFEPARHIETVSFEEQQRLWAADNRRDISEYDAEARDPGTTVASLICGHRPRRILEEQAARELLARLELSDLLERGIRFLSSGQIRKVLVARALLSRTPGQHRLLILDDPLEAIDRQSAPLVRELLQQWMGEDTATLLLSRREREILPGITHLAVLEDLQLVEHGPADAIRAGTAYRRFAQPQVNFPEALPQPAQPREPAAERVAPVQLRDVSASYGDQPVLNRVNWLMDVGDHTLIEGPNGCGKSTLLSLIDGENHKAYGQQVILFGTRRGSGESVWDIKAHFGIVSNEIHHRYVKGWKVIDVVVSGFFDSLGLYDDSGASQEELALNWLSALGLASLARDYFHEISFGQQRLVLLARAMVKQPDVLILDEPCVGLDDRFRLQVLGTVDLIAAQTATQIIYVSHTEGEEPGCITQRLRFEPAAGGGYHLVAATPE